MKKEIIVLNNKGRLANQLWLATAVYTYCLEKKYKYSNYTFFTYQEFFDKKSNNWFIDNILIYLPNKLTKFIYTFFVKLIKIFKYKQVIKDGYVEMLLPPSKNVDFDYLPHNKIYLDGWLFRNPTGIQRYRKEILQYFKPAEKYNNRVNEFIKEQCVGDYKLVGVHVRHGDYKIWNDGKYYFSFVEVRKVLDDFLSSQLNSEKIKFIICSDDKIDEAAFVGLNYIKGLNTPVEDLYTLANTNLIIGSNSTFGSWASYYGQIPFVRFSRKKIDWKKI